jgi:hypothetical protein
VTYIQLRNVRIKADRCVMLQLLFSGQLTLIKSTSVDIVAGEPQAVTAANVFRRWVASGSFARTSSRSIVRSTFRRCIPYSPRAVGFGLLRWSVAGSNPCFVQLSCLFELHVMGANFCYRTYPVLVWACSFPSAQQACRSFCRVIYVEGTLKGPQSTTTADTLTPRDTVGFL